MLHILLRLDKYSSILACRHRDPARRYAPHLQTRLRARLPTGVCATVVGKASYSTRKQSHLDSCRYQKRPRRRVRKNGPCHANGLRRLLSRRGIRSWRGPDAHAADALFLRLRRGGARCPGTEADPRSGRQVVPRSWERHRRARRSLAGLANGGAMREPRRTCPTFALVETFALVKTFALSIILAFTSLKTFASPKISQRPQCTRPRRRRRLRACACARALYCSETCQRLHWREGGHRETCKGRTGREGA